MENQKETNRNIETKVVIVHKVKRWCYWV